jgi:hypothetical protein
VLFQVLDNGGSAVHSATRHVMIIRVIKSSIFAVLMHDFVAFSNKFKLARLFLLIVSPKGRVFDQIRVIELSFASAS